MSTETTVASNLVERTIADFEARLEELRPSLDEAQEIQRALKSIRRTPSAGSGEGRRGRSPERANEFIAVVREHPGSTVAEVADYMGIEKANYLYRVAAKAVEDGLLVKEGTTYTAVP